MNKRFCNRLLIFVLGLLLSGFNTFVCAKPLYENILIIYNKRNNNYKTAADDLQKHFRKQSSLKIHSLDISKIKADTLDAHDLIIALGTLATQAAIKTNTRSKIVSAFIPRISFETLRHQYARANNITALILDQPFSRRMAYIRQFAPHTKTVGVILGPATERYRTELMQAAADNHFKLMIESIKNEDELFRTLEKVLSNADILLPIIDPLVFNRKNAQTILLTAYRYKKPILGISTGYLKAGALAAIFSTPQQLTEQLIEEIEAISHGKHLHRHLVFPNRFAIDINRKIAPAFNMGMHMDLEKMKKDLMLQEKKP